MCHIGFYDGSASPNSGKLGLGVTIYASKKELVCAAKPAGDGTNNEAEYLALIFLLELAIDEGIKNITVYGDSKLITNQVNGIWGVGKETLVKYHEKAVALSKQFSNIEFKWCKRANNKRADILSKRGGQLSEAKFARIKPKPTKEIKKIDTENLNASCLPNQNAILKPDVVKFFMPKVVSISQSCFLITDGNGISKLEIWPVLRCSCKLFFKEGTCIHTDSFLKLKGKKGS